ncbi:MAG: dihydropteroate synthase [Chthoniobacter sp.]|uniref:dihydropteroate synthase n=1 Tax=Chthoniobacter sp. TaxID=2510640 RepID=UPI0032A81B3A
MTWQTRTRTLDLAQRGLIMGVVNVTSDSFSDGGQFAGVKSAVAQARQLVAEGAAIIDIGGESTRPGAQPVPETEELQRVLPVIERLAGDARFILSIDTMKPAVARAAIEAGVEIVNDVTGLRDPAMRAVVRETGAGAIAMHMQGSPRDMQRAPHYDDVVAEIRDFFRQTFSACLACGIDPMRLAFDPGIGFGKTVEHNFALLRSLDAMKVEGRPLVLGVSRKSFLGKIAGSDALADRAWPTVALTSYGRTRGANVFRVHEARPNLEALRMTEAILDQEAAA